MSPRVETIGDDNKPTNHCEVCGRGYWVKPYRRARSRYCSQRCAGAAHAKKFLNSGPKPWAGKNLDGHRHKSPTQFKAGHKPWNVGKKHIHLSPKTEWKKGRPSEKILPIGSVTIRADKAGKPRAWIKTAQGWRPRAQVVFEGTFGHIPGGHIVHHRDGDTLNDRPSNLLAVTRAEHIEEHRHDLKYNDAPGVGAGAG